MLAFSLSTSFAHPLSLSKKNFITFKTKSQIPQSCSYSRLCFHHITPRLNQQQQPPSAFLGFNPLRISVNGKAVVMKKTRHGLGAVCYAAPLTTTNLQWVAAVSTAGEYGFWTVFLALLVRLFFFIPGELELLFVSLLLVIVAPYQVMNLRGKQEGVIISLIIAAYLAFQHYSRAGSLRRAFDQGSIIASLAIICIVAVPCFLLI